MLLNPILIPITLLIAITVIINNVLRYRLQKRIIDSGLLDEQLVKTMLKPVGLNQDALKWGLLFLFGGIGLVTIEFLPDQTNKSALPYGIEAIALSMGFLLYYVLIQRTTERTEAALPAS